MTESNISNVFGINTTGKDVKYKNRSRDRDDDPIVSSLVSEVFMSEDKKNLKLKENENPFQFSNNYIIEFGVFLKKKGVTNIFKEYKELIEEENKKMKKEKKKEKKLSKKEQMKIDLQNEKIIEDMNKFFNNLSINEKHYPLKKNKLHESFLNIIYWLAYLLKNKKDLSISIEVYFDCAISLFRALKVCNSMINSNVIEIIKEKLKELNKIIKKKKEDDVSCLFKNYFYLIDNSFWDKNKPNAISLYPEQKEVIDSIEKAVSEDNPLLMFYWVPPANGKTLISVIIAKKLAQISNEKQKINPSFKRKSLLYICYNEIVRNSVENLCLTHGVDLKFWLATYRTETENGYWFVRFRPDKSCFPEPIKNKTKHLYLKDKKFERFRFSNDLRIQMLQYLDETRFIVDRTNNPFIYEIHESGKKEKTTVFEWESIETANNFPEMIISDLDSAYHILKEFPDNFVPYFDEAFAASNQMVTAKILSVLPKQSVLVSATLASKEEIPHTINRWSEDFSTSDIDINEQIKYIYSSKQHINCQFISPDGYIISPHHHLDNADQIKNFCKVIQKNPLVQRGYSNLIVLKMYLELKDVLPDNIKLDNLFQHYGSLSNTNIRNYGIKLLEFCSINTEYFDKIKKIKIEKIKDNTVNNIFTKNAYVYQNDNTLHVSNPENYQLYLNEISHDLLDGSPKLKKLIQQYESKMENIQKELENCEKNTKLKDLDKEYQLNEIRIKFNDVKFDYPSEFIMNSQSHCMKFNENIKMSHYQSKMFDPLVITEFDDISAKLFLSNIGVYNQTSLSVIEMQTFLRFKDDFKFICSDPSIIYGTNINLTMIDIHENMSLISTKNTLYQLIGRAGRKGKSSSANVIFRNWDLFHTIVSDDQTNIEASNIEKNLQEIIEK